jgi:hypothetical protein
MVICFSGDISTTARTYKGALEQIIASEPEELVLDLTRVTALGLEGRNMLYWILAQISAWSPIQLSALIKNIPAHRIVCLDPRLKANLPYRMG